MALQLGLAVLLEGIGETLNPILNPLLEKKLIVSSGGRLTIEFGNQMIDYSAQFKLFITTKHQNPHFMPEVSNKVAVINFTITHSGLRDQMLDLII